jgi:SAM-dependent MidA family methyltransferase
MAERPVPEEFLARFREEAESDGFLTFEQFQELALYAPRYGYYSRPGSPLGREGDFYTAPHVTPLFGETLAERLVAAWAELSRPERFRVVELGPGDGMLASDLVRRLAPLLPEGTVWEYVLAERSPVLREVATERLRRVESPRIRLRAAESLAGLGPFTGVVLANEVLDAQPARRFRFAEGRWWELGVRLSGDAFREEMRPLVRPVPGAPLPAQAADGAVLEISPAAEGLLREVADRLSLGLAIFLDYGEEEGYWTGRPSSGTLTAYRGHRVPADPFESPGTADLSVWVDFTRLRVAARTAGLVERGFRRQAEALNAWGFGRLLDQWLKAAPDVTERVRRQLASKNLLFGFERFYALELEAPGSRNGPVRA